MSYSISLPDHLSLLDHYLLGPSRASVALPMGLNFQYRCTARFEDEEDDEDEHRPISYLDKIFPHIPTEHLPEERPVRLVGVENSSIYLNRPKI